MATCAVFLFGGYLPELGRTGGRSGTSEVYGVRDQLGSIGNRRQRYDLGSLSVSHEQRSWTEGEKNITRAFIQVHVKGAMKQ